MKHDRIAVIGAGLGGLAAAAVLAARGHPVTLFDKNSWFGGKAALLEEEGFRFDMGPTILTVPAVLERIFAEAGERLSDHLDLIRLDPQWRCFFEGGATLDLVEDTAAMAERLDRFAHSGTGARYRDFQKLAERLNEISERFFFWRSVEDLRDTIDFKRNLSPGTLSDVIALRMGRSVAGVIRSHIGDERIAQMLDHFTQYVGSSPFAAPAVLCSIAHMQASGGVWYPKGGTRAVANALAALAERRGAKLVSGVEVTGIELQEGSVRAIRTADGVSHAVAAAVSNMDSLRTYRELLGGTAGARLLNRGYEPACSGVVLYLGLSKAYDHLLHHNFVFSASAAEEFRWIYGVGEPAPDPTCYVAAPARTDPSVAPQGGEALYVLVHTPYLRPHHNWSAMLSDYRRIILEKLKRTAGLADIEERIVFERVLTPQDIHDRYKVLDGAIYGLASHGRFLGAFKPGNRSRDVKGLYLAGGAAHPGPGMPMVMMSGWIAADALDRDLRARPLASIA